MASPQESVNHEQNLTIHKVGSCFSAISQSVHKVTIDNLPLITHTLVSASEEYLMLLI